MALLGLLLGVAALARRSMRLRHDLGTIVASTDEWRPIPQPPQPLWVAPVDGECPASHPIKAKDSSGIFHLPGMFVYERTQPDRCYQSEAAAIADGFVKAKR